MIEEYENWEDTIRQYFIELADFMNKDANPIDALIDFAWSTGADRFWINNAKDELKKLKQQAEELIDLKKSLAKPVAFAKINDHGDLYDLRLQNNPYNDQNKVVPLYRINHG